jgi:hypothetical protein
MIVLAASASGIGIYASWLTVKDWWLFFLPWLVAATIPLVALGAWWLWWPLPKREAERLRSTLPDTKARADVEDNFRKTAGQAIGGAAVLLGATLLHGSAGWRRELGGVGRRPLP